MSAPGRETKSKIIGSGTVATIEFALTIVPLIKKVQNIKNIRDNKDNKGRGASVNRMTR